MTELKMNENFTLFSNISSQQLLRGNVSKWFCISWKTPCCIIFHEECVECRWNQEFLIIIIIHFLMFISELNGSLNPILNAIFDLFSSNYVWECVSINWSILFLYKHLSTVFFNLLLLQFRHQFSVYNLQFKAILPSSVCLITRCLVTWL